MDKKDIVSVISKHVKLKKLFDGRYWGLCPFHEEKIFSFAVNPKKGIYYCFGCKKSGDVNDFLQRIKEKNNE